MRRGFDRVANLIQSRKLARALTGPSAREIRASWTATDRRFGTGRYRWYRKGLRAEMRRLRMNEKTWRFCPSA